MDKLNTPRPLPKALAHALRRLSQAVQRCAWDLWPVRGLTPTQTRILKILGSREDDLTISMVAHELGSTSATISESATTLAEKKLLFKQRKGSDGRSLILGLTATGRQLVKELDELPDLLASTFATLPTSEQEALYRLSIKLIRGLEEQGLLPPSRMCARCQFFDPFRFAGADSPHFCHRLGAAVAEGQLRIDCALFESGTQEEQAALWKKFAAENAEKLADERRAGERRRVASNTGAG